MQETFKHRLARQELLVGIIITLPSPEIVEILCRSGLDWLFVDLEHSVLSVRDAQIILQAASPRVPCVVRIPSNHEVWFKKVLDIGTPGVIVPQIRTAEDALRAVRYCKYPPQGIRSAGIGRAQGYGDAFQDYIDHANDDIAVILQIEHIEAVNNLDKIIKIDGIDGLFVGPYDLSASLGKTGLTTDTDVQNAISTVKKYAQQARIPLGIFGTTAQAVKPYIDSGYTLIAAGTDTLLLGNAARNISALLK